MALARSYRSPTARHVLVTILRPVNKGGRACPIGTCRCPTPGLLRPPTPLRQHGFGLFVSSSLLSTLTARASYPFPLHILCRSCLGQAPACCIAAFSHMANRAPASQLLQMQTALASAGILDVLAREAHQLVDLVTPVSDSDIPRPVGDLESCGQQALFAYVFIIAITVVLLQQE